MTTITRVLPGIRSGHSVVSTDTGVGKTQTIPGVGAVTFPLGTPPSSTIEPPLVTVVQTFYSPTIGGKNYLDAPFITSTTNLYAPDFVLGSYPLAAPLIGSTTSLYAPTLEVGSVTLFPPVLDENDLLPPPSANMTQFLLPALLTNSQGFFSHDFVPGDVTIEPDLVTNTSTLPPPSLDRVVWVLLPPLLPSGAQLYAPGFDRGTSELAPPLLDEQDSLPSPDLHASGVLLPQMLVNGSAPRPPSITSRATISPPLYIDADSLPAASLTGGGIIFPPLLTDADNLPSPAMQRVKGQGNGGGGNASTLAANLKYASAITMSESGLITALQTQIGQAKTANTRMVVYADASGVPGAKLAESTVKTTVTLGTNSYTLITPLAVLAGTTLWIALHTDASIKNVLQPQVSGARYNTDAFSDGASDPFGPASVDNNRSPLFVVFLEAVNAVVSPPLNVSAGALPAPTFIRGVRTMLPPVTGEDFLYPPELQASANLDAPLAHAGGGPFPPALQPGLTDLRPPLVVSGALPLPPAILPPTGVISPPLVGDGALPYEPALSIDLIVIEPPLVDSGAATLAPELDASYEMLPPLLMDDDSLPGPDFGVSSSELFAPFLSSSEQLLFDPALEREPGFLLAPLLNNDGRPLPPSFGGRRRAHRVYIRGSVSNRPSIFGSAIGRVDIDGDASGVEIEMEGNDA